MEVLSIIPPVLAIAFVIWKKEVIFALLIAIFSAECILLYMHRDFSIFVGFSQTLERIVGIFQSDGNTRILIFSLVIGGLLGLIKVSGGVAAVVNWLVRSGFASTRRRVGLLTTITGVVVFIESNLSVLTAGILSRGLFDKFAMSRERLAYIIDSTSAPVCILLLLNAWGAFVLALLENEQLNVPAVSVLVGTIPLNFYALITLAIVFLTVWRDKTYGPLAKCEQNSHESQTEEVYVEASHVSYMLIPLLILVGGMVVLMYVTGYQSTPVASEHSFFDILSSGSGSKSVFYSTVLATLVAFFMLLFKGTYRHVELVKITFKGMGELLPLVGIVLLSLALGDSLRELGTGVYIAQMTGDFLPVYLIAPMLFLTGALISFSTGTSWGTFAILIPLGVPLINMLNLPPALMISAILGGGIFGDHCSPISDTTAVSSIAAGCDLLDHVRTQLPYALVAGGLTLVFYFIASFLMID
ncbi:MAG: Na+/H+ antiporter NhaC family protein [bacterium]